MPISEQQRETVRQALDRLRRLRRQPISDAEWQAAVRRREELMHMWALAHGPVAAKFRRQDAEAARKFARVHEAVLESERTAAILQEAIAELKAVNRTPELIAKLNQASARIGRATATLGATIPEIEDVRQRLKRPRARPANRQAREVVSALRHAWQELVGEPARAQQSGGERIGPFVDLVRLVLKAYGIKASGQWQIQLVLHGNPKRRTKR